MARGYYCLFKSSDSMPCLQLNDYGKRIEAFLPFIEHCGREKHSRKQIHLPLFLSYLLVRIEIDADIYLEILKTGGVVRVLCSDGRPASIPHEQIQAIQILTKNGMDITSHPYLKEGMRVQVVNGPLSGVDGILTEAKLHKHRLVLCVDLLQKSVCVEIDEFDVEYFNLQ